MCSFRQINGECLHHDGGQDRGTLQVRGGLSSIGKVNNYFFIVYNSRTCQNPQILTVEKLILFNSVIHSFTFSYNMRHVCFQDETQDIIGGKMRWTSAKYFLEMIFIQQISFRFKGKTLEGKSYIPIFDYFEHVSVKNQLFPEVLELEEIPDLLYYVYF